MKVGLSKDKLDLSRKQIVFKTSDGKEHWISFRYSMWCGIYHSGVWVDGHDVEVTSAYPALPRVLRECLSWFWYDLKRIVRKRFLRNKKDRNR